MKKKTKIKAAEKPDIILTLEEWFQKLNQEHKPDLTWVDPLLSEIGGSDER